VTVAIHSETGEKLVIYQKLYDDYKVYARPYDMFVSEVDHIKYPEVTQKYRFELVVEGTLVSNESLVEQNISEDNLEDNLDDDSEETFGEEGADPRLLEFLDADTFEEKKQLLISMRNQITDRLIDDMAASIDVTVEAGDIEERYHSLMTCINTRAKFEVDRFR
jgi:hypothetical protein